MFVVKRSGRREHVQFDKITARIKKLCYSLDDKYVDPVRISQKVVQGVYDGVTTFELDELAAEISASCATQHPDFSILAARISVSNLHKQTTKVFSECMTLLHDHINSKTGTAAPLLSDEVYEFVEANRDALNSAIIHDRDFDYDYFGFRTLEKSYLMRLDGVIVERPQFMIMRVAVGIHCGDLAGALRTYELMSQRFFTHATPTLFNASTPRPQLSSCFLLTMKDDSIEGIYDTLKRCACISKYAGGIGLSIHNIRSTNSYIHGTNGTSNGIVPMLRVFNNTARYVDQGGGKRKGSIAIYLEPWHPDIFSFLDLRKNTGNELERARDLFYALWISDLFMRRVESDGDWSLFDPNECRGLADCYGAEFEALYGRYETEGRARKVIKARELWSAILDSQIETGTPYMLYKDAANEKSNQKNVGTIKSSNLCTEIMEYTSPDEVAVCNLASINLSALVIGGPRDTSATSIAAATSANATTPAAPYVPGGHAQAAAAAAAAASALALVDKENAAPAPAPAPTADPTTPVTSTSTDKKTLLSSTTSTAPAVRDSSEGVGGARFDFVKLHEVTKVVTKNLNKVIDVNYYPIEEAKRSNMRHRPIGIGVQGLADCFIKMGHPFDSPEAKQLNIDIFESIYHAAVEASCEVAAEEGPYETYPGSPISQGKFQFDLWNQPSASEASGSGRYDWNELRAKVQQHGVRNSLLLAPMPTASTAQILGNNESVEPFTSNMYNRRVLAGEFTVVNKYLLRDLVERGLWTPDVRNQIIADGGSVQNVGSIPEEIKVLYKTVWEIKQRNILDMAADRGAYICQSQSLNIHLAEPTVGKLTSMHFYAWKKGLKTGMYYLRTRPKADAIQFTVDQAQLAKSRETNESTGEKAIADGGKKEGAEKIIAGGATGVSSPLRVNNNTRAVQQKEREREMEAEATRRRQVQEEEEEGECLSCGA